MTSHATVTYKEDRRAYNRRKYHEYRHRNLLFVSQGETPKCAQCRSTENLELDHIDPSAKSFSVHQFKSLKNEMLREELRKCQILCRRCHTSKSRDELISRQGSFQHGTVYAFMKKKCKCEQCRSFKRQWYDERNAKRRLGAEGT